MDDADLAFIKLRTALVTAELQIEGLIAELTEDLPAEPPVPAPRLDLDDKAKMLVYRILELLEEDAEDMVEKLEKVSSHLYKHVTGKWPHEVATEDEWRMRLHQGTHNEPYKVNSCTY
jgi:hypothetical protein